MGGPSITTALGPGNGSTRNANNTTHNSNMATTNRDPKTAKATRSERARKKKDEKREKDKQSEDKTIKEKEDKSSKDDVTEADIKLERKDGRRTPLHARDMEPDESYMHMMCNNNWYLFIDYITYFVSVLRKCIIRQSSLQAKNRKTKRTEE